MDDAVVIVAAFYACPCTLAVLRLKGLYRRPFALDNLLNMSFEYF